MCWCTLSPRGSAAAGPLERARRFAHTRRMFKEVFAAAAVAIPLMAQNSLPTVVVEKDDTVITNSCVIQIAQSLVIPDANTNGVLHIAASGITVRFAPGSELRGSASTNAWDTLRGIGIRVDGQVGVTIENARVHGFKNGLVATRANGMMISGGDFSDNYRQRLKSKRGGEANEDWLYPHRNDEVKWRDQYGGAVCVESSEGVTIRKIKVRRGQNGIILDRVDDSRIYDNDCSFLSGWGLAMWRSSRNRIDNNAFDFCIRGHLEGAYNRGQDSAGILAFEQCNENWFVNNSATHGGDGFFGFAGHEAIGETWFIAEREKLKALHKTNNVDHLITVPATMVRNQSALGCNRNVFMGNDFSYASAHGLELTFSEDNRFFRNRFVENGVTGIWGGYTTRAVIAENEFVGNGELGYGLERGAVNMEHSSENLIAENRFVNNKCGVHLWWDDDGALMRYPGVAGNNIDVRRNFIVENHFEVNRDLDMKGLREGTKIYLLQLRDETRHHLGPTYFAGNTVKMNHPMAVQFDAPTGLFPLDFVDKVPRYKIPKYEALGEKRPVGARRQWRGRQFISIDQWGPKQLD